MEVSIETVNNKQVTIIRKPFDAEWVKKQLKMGIPVLVELLDDEEFAIARRVCTSRKVYPPMIELSEYRGASFNRTDGSISYAITILPALPHHPKPEDAPLLYRYMAEGLIPNARFTTETGRISWCSLDETSSISLVLRDAIEQIVEITHAIHNGERVEIAIEGGL